MQTIKDLIKKNFSNFVWFYRYLGNRIFVAFFLSISVGVLDGLGLTMFFPLLQVVGEGGVVDAAEMGQLGVVIQALEDTGISLTILTILLTMIVFFLLKGCAVYMQRVYQVFLQQSFIRKIRLSLIERLNQMAFKSFITSDVGRIQNTMTGEIEKVNGAFVTYMSTFQQGMMVLVYLSFAAFANIQFTVLVIIGGFLANLIYRTLYVKTKNASRALVQYSSGYQGLIIQHIAHFKYLKATGHVHKYGRKMKKTITEIERHRKRIGIINAVTVAAREPILVIVIACIIFVQVHFFGGAMGTIIISLLFFYRALTSLIGLQESWNHFMANSGSLENVQYFQEELINNREKDGEIEYLSLTTGIAINDVDFYYEKTQILKSINLTIPKNISIAFVGESGSGKTTLVSMIAGLLPASMGNIHINNIKLEEFKKETYQKKIGFVTQDPVVFDDTIFNNVTFWAEPTEVNIARFNRALDKAAIGDFIQQLPEGKETQLGNNGINLSGGQKQRISIARELYKDIDILILDEATSALDTETEMEIQVSINNLKGQYTILIIAHRLSTIRHADQIVFMDRGKIVAIDTFDNLMERQNRFRKMVELQGV